MQFLNPCNDVAFKKIFGSENHKNITISFLNSILEYTGDRAIQTIQFLNTEQLALVRDEKKENILDVMCVDHAGNRYIVEIQVKGVKEFGKRMVYYGAKTYALQLGKGKPYHELAPVIVLAIVGFTMFPRKIHYKSQHFILDKDTYERDLQELAFVFVELNKFNKQEDELKTIEEKWLYFLKEIKSQTTLPASLDHEELAQACHIAERIGWSEAELNAYEDAFIRATDDDNKLAYALEQGMAKGLEQGIAKGFEQGRESMTINLLRAGVAITTIAQITGYSLEYLQNLKKKIQ